MTDYVEGFLFDPEYERVALIKKNRGPDSIVGKWNGIGGKVDPGESFEESMRREFLEETGLVAPHWNRFCNYQFQNGDVIAFFTAVSWGVKFVKTMEDEEVKVWFLSELHRLDTVYNLNWIIPLATATYLHLPVEVSE